MRADYTSLYGFPIDTTPYLRKSNGLALDEFIAPAPNTQTSLTRMLHLTQDDIASYPNNIISLAKAAGFKTYWLSTQPTSDDADTAAARVGIQADYSHFYDPNSSRDGKNSISDFILLDGLAEQLKQMKNTQNSLFVLHINGSHPDFCKRLIQPETFAKKPFPRQPEPKQRFSAVSLPQYLLILPKCPLNPPWIPD